MNDYIIIHIGRFEDYEVLRIYLANSFVAYSAPYSRKCLFCLFTNAIHTLCPSCVSRYVIRLYKLTIPYILQYFFVNHLQARYIY